jgi:hypothetical protein
VTPLDLRWPLATPALAQRDPWLCVRVSVYDLAAVVDTDPAHAPSLAALACEGLRSLPPDDRARVCAALEASGSAAVVVAVLVGAVLRLESARVGHLICCGADARRVSPALALRGLECARGAA